MANDNGERFWTKFLYHALGYLAAKFVGELRRVYGVRPWRRRPGPGPGQATGGARVAGLIATNEILNSVAGSVRTLLTSGTFYLRLFVNDFSPGPDATDPGDYDEATFTSYAGILIDASYFGAPFVAATGNVQTNSGVFAWPPPASGTQTVYGWWIESDGKVWFTQRFLTPQIVGPASPPLAFVIRLQELARSILPC